jgi:serine/threonine protein kinase
VIHTSLTRILLTLRYRVVLYGQLYLIHWAGVCHRDFQPQNVLRKGWCRLKIIDFAFSDLNHTCPGWESCGELRNSWYEELKLDRLPVKNDTLGKVRLIAFMVFGLFLLFLHSFFISLKVW